jgi:hypothetical protein
MTTNMTYLIIGIVLLGVFISYKYFNQEENIISKTDNSELTNPNEQNQYHELRELALTADPEKLDMINIDNDKVFGIVTDMSMTNGVATLVAFLSGDTSLYLSSGGAFIGAGQHEEVNQKVQEIVQNLQKYKKKGILVDTAELPKSDQMIFNLLTKDGIYQISAIGIDIMSGKSEYVDLYKEVDKLMTLIRLKSGE